MKSITRVGQPFRQFSRAFSSCPKPIYTQISNPLSFENTRRNSSTMSEMKVVFTEKAAPPAGPYSQAIATPTTIYCSGQIPATPTGEVLTEGSIAEMTEACIANLSAVLTAAGSSIERVVKVNVFLTTMDSFAEMNEVYARHFAHRPARSCVAVHQLPKGVPVEIECIALV